MLRNYDTSSRTLSQNTRGTREDTWKEPDTTISNRMVFGGLQILRLFIHLIRQIDIN